MHILGLEGETEEAVEPFRALSSTGFYGSTFLFHGWSICFQNHTIYPYVVPCKVVGFSYEYIVMLGGPLRKPHILLALVVV